MSQIHRFRSRVAISLTKGGTHYLTADEAERVAAHLLKVAASIRTESFANSPPLTLTFESSPDAGF